MPTLFRISCAVAVATLALAPLGCSSVSPYELRQSQLRSRQLYEQNKSLSAQRDQYNQMAQTLASEKNQLAQQAATLQQELSIANQ